MFIKENCNSIFTSSQIENLFGDNQGKTLLDYLCKKNIISKKYYIDNNWIPSKNINSEKKLRIRGVGYILNELEEQAIKDVASTWNYIKSKSFEKPVYQERILEQLAEERLNSEGKLKFFSPWGPRYKNPNSAIKKDDPEIRTLNEMKNVLEQFSNNGYIVELVLMPADVYGTEINGLPENFVYSYFRNLKNVAEDTIKGSVDIKVIPWSEIRDENMAEYSKLKNQIKISRKEYNKSVKTAKNFNPDKPEESAKQYCIERLAEAEIIEKCYSPIKLSLVRREKDSLDGLLKRVYMIENKAPWMEGN